MQSDQTRLITRLRRAFAAQGIRSRLADPDALIHFSILGLMAGVLAGLSITAFRLIVESTLAAGLPGGDPENFEGLAAPARFLLVLGGALLIGALAQLIRPEWRQVGVPHVIDRFNRHRGYMPKGNLLWQFAGGVLALVSGQSSGREGPSVHIGAAVSSIAGKRLKLPDNSIQILVGCGTAASIAAAFDTPLAGVIFAMEVVMMEYTIAGFVPIILAAAAGATVSRAVFGDALHFRIAELPAYTLGDLPAIAALGLAAGAGAALFVAVQERAMRFRDWQPFTRIALGGLLSALAVLAVPQAMGVGYDSLNAALLGELGLLTLAALGITKLLLSATVSGLGMPVGVIGPTLLVGGCIGGLLCGALALVSAPFAGAHALYVLLGMVATMGACLNAPLAALVAVVELSGSTAVMLPGMIAVIVANLGCRVLFGQASTWQNSLEALGVQMHRDPLRRTLERTGVLSLMDRDIVILAADPLVAGSIERLRSSAAHWAILRHERGHWLAPRADLLAHLEQETALALRAPDIPFAERCCDVPAQCSLGEAWQRLEEDGLEVACVIEPLALDSVLGIVRREQLRGAATEDLMD